MPEENTSFVIDASYVLGYLLPDEEEMVDFDIFNRYKRKELNLIAPSILPFEVTNALKFTVKSKRISIRKAQILLKGFLYLSIPLSEVYLPQVLTFSQKKEISAYDASYIVLAKSRKSSLLTLDKKMQKVF